MNGLTLLKQGLLKQTSSEQEAVSCLCMLMETCGGYEELMNIPLSAVEPILKYLKWKQEQENKKFAAMFGGKKK